MLRWTRSYNETDRRGSPIFIEEPRAWETPDIVGYRKYGGHLWCNTAKRRAFRQIKRDAWRKRQTEKRPLQDAKLLVKLVERAIAENNTEGIQQKATAIIERPLLWWIKHKGGRFAK